MRRNQLDRPSRLARRGRAAHRRAGLTMVEIMIAIGVLLVAVLAAFSSQVASMNLVSGSRETDTAISDLQACMEQVLTLPAGDIPVAGSEFQAGQPVAAFTDLHLEDERLVCSYPGYVPGGEVPNPLTIVLTLTWSDHKGRERSQTLRTLKAR